MVFSSLFFLFYFLPVFWLLYLAALPKGRNLFLFLASLFFYAWGEPKYVLLLMFMALTSWFCALRVERAASQGRRRLWVAVSCAIDILLIGFFKYSGLVCSVFGQVPGFIADIALPIGISFYTFQLLTYVVDVYRGDAEAQPSYLNVLLYAALFHQCVAGPIVRYKTIAHELFVERDSRDLLPGISRFTVGLAKKTLLANPCGALADQLLLATDTASDAALFAENLHTLSGLSALGAWVGVAAFMLQIYLDFSAYSDMAIGMGRMLGLHYLENFDYPYMSKTVTEFWRRWHISLGTFFRDYVYIPLGGRQCSKARSIFNLFVVWALTGLWHGANWNFVLWGLYFFVFIVLERLFLKRLFEKLHVLPHIYLVFVVFAGWILFHFTDVRLGWTVFLGLFTLNGNAASDFVSLTLLKNNLFLLGASVVACTPFVKCMANGLGRRLRRSAAGQRLWNLLAYILIPIILLLLSTASLVGDSYNPFIYFNF